MISRAFQSQLPAFSKPVLSKPICARQRAAKVEAK
jgi:hypothetical protein